MGNRLLRRVGVVVAVAASSMTLTACHELWCAFVEGLTAQPLDCSHDDFPDLGDIPIPSVPPPPPLPTNSSSTTTTTTPTTTTTTTTSTTTTLPEPTTTTTTTEPTTTTTGVSPTTPTTVGERAPTNRERLDELARRLARV